jgi:hypothetical protein
VEICLVELLKRRLKVGVGIYFDKERVLTGRLPDCVFFSSIKICKMGEMEQKTRESKRRALRKEGEA